MTSIGVAPHLKQLATAARVHQRALDEYATAAEALAKQKPELVAFISKGPNAVEAPDTLIRQTLKFDELARTVETSRTNLTGALSHAADQAPNEPAIHKTYEAIREALGSAQRGVHIRSSLLKSSEARSTMLTSLGITNVHTSGPEGTAKGVGLMGMIVSPCFTPVVAEYGLHSATSQGVLAVSTGFAATYVAGVRSTYSRRATSMSQKAFVSNLSQLVDHAATGTTQATTGHTTIKKFMRGIDQVAVNAREQQRVASELLNLHGIDKLDTQAQTAIAQRQSIEAVRAEVAQDVADLVRDTQTAESKAVESVMS